MIARALLAVLLGVATLAWEKLPPLSPEEQAAAAQKKAQQSAQQAEEKNALERVQDRIAEAYKRTHSTSGATSGTTEQKDLPKETRVLPEDEGPHGGRTPSAEAHSAPAH